MKNVYTMAQKIVSQTPVDNQPTDTLGTGTEQIPAADKMARTERSPRKPRILQPLETLNVPGARLRIGTVEVVVGLKRSSIYARIQNDKFPAPIKCGSRCSRWSSDSIRAWLATH